MNYEDIIDLIQQFMNCAEFHLTYGKELQGAEQNDRLKGRREQGEKKKKNPKQKRYARQKAEVNYFKITFLLEDSRNPSAMT